MSSGLDLPCEGARYRIESKDGLIAIVRSGDGAHLGSVDAEVDGLQLTIRSVCVDEAERGYGAGTEAMRLLLQAAPASFSSARATAPPDNGLAVYFWFRMGFRPQFGLAQDGSLRFVRELP